MTPELLSPSCTSQVYTTPWMDAMYSPLPCHLTTKAEYNIHTGIQKR